MSGALGRGNGPESKSGRTGAAEATVQPREPAPLRALWQNRPGGAENHGLWLALDRLQDPHNVGAVFRTAAFFGVRGIVLTRDRSAPLNSTSYDVAAGGMEHVPFAVETNLSRALASAKSAGLWTLGASEHAAEDIGHFQPDRPWLLVLGSEERGLRRLTRENCDALCRLTPHGPLATLNVSVAAALLIAALTQ